MSLDFARYLNVRSATMPVTAPDGARVAFLSDITGNAQVWSVTTHIGSTPRWPEQLTFFSDKVWEIHGTPCAEHLVAVGDVGGNERQQLYLVTGFGAGSHDVIRLTADDAAVHRFGAFSRDGRQIVYTSNARNPADFDPYLLDLATGEQRRLAEMTGNRTIVAWSPDGAQLLLLDAVATEEIELYLLELKSGAIRQLMRAAPAARYHAIAWTPDGIYLLSDRTCDHGAVCRLDWENDDLTEIVAADALLAELGESLAGELELLAVASDTRRAAFTLNVQGYSELYLLDLVNGSYQALNRIPRGVIANLSFSAGGSQLLFDLQSAARNPDIWLYDVNDGFCRQLTFSNRAGIDSKSFVTPELIHFTSHDGRTIPAFYYLPPAEVRNRRLQREEADKTLGQQETGLPCILYVHGGPASQQRPDFDVRFQYFLQRGYALLVPNVRGSTGYGRTYMMLDDLEKRMDSVADLKDAVRWLHTRPEIDAARVAIYGRSYGGYMVLAALTEYPELFAAGIDVVGIANWVTFMERTSAWRRAHREREYGSLANQRELLEQLSPIHRIARVSVPLLVVAGDNDPRVPLFESEQVVARVRGHGGTVEFIHYADEGHKISKLHNRIDSFTRMAAFLDRYLAP